MNMNLVDLKPPFQHYKVLCYVKYLGHLRRSVIQEAFDPLRLDGYQLLEVVW